MTISKIVRDDPEVRLNDLLCVCQEAARHYTLAVEVMVENAAAAIFKTIAASRTDMCSRIERFIRERGYFPAAPDPDRQTMRNLAERVDTFISRDEPTTVLARSAHIENEIQSCFQALFTLSWPEALHHELRKIEMVFKGGRQMIDDLLASRLSHPQAKKE